MVLQLIEDFVHLEGGRQRLDEDGRLDRAGRQAEQRLRLDEDIVPQTRFEIAFELRQIEIGAGASGQRCLGIEEDIEAEVEQRAGDDFAIERRVGFIEMPAARPDDERRNLLLQRIGLAVARIDEIDLVRPAIPQVDLAGDHVRERRRGGILEVGHEDLRAGIERIDDHLAIDRAGDLDTAIEEIGRQGGDLPVASADLSRLGCEIRQLAGIIARLTRLTRRQKLQPPLAELRLQARNKSDSLRRQDFMRALRQLAGELKRRGGCGHDQISQIAGSSRHVGKHSASFPE